MGETLDPDGRPAGEPGPGIARLATLATGASALVVAGWCGAFVNRALDAAPAVPAVPSVVLPPLGAAPAPEAASAPPPASRVAVVAPARTAVSGVVTRAAVFTAAAVAAPRSHEGVTHVPVPVRAARLTSTGPGEATTTAAADAPRLSTATPLTAPTAPTSAPAGDGPPSRGAGASAGPAPVLRADATPRHSFAAGADQGRSAGPGRATGRDNVGDGDVDRG